MRTMKIISWNIRFQGLGARLASVVDSVSDEAPDILLLQEAGTEHLPQLNALLRRAGLPHAIDSLNAAPPRPPQYRTRSERKHYATLIASRWPVERTSDRWRARAPYPETLLRAQVSLPDGPKIDIFNVHIPNGSGNGWRKIATLDVLYAALVHADDSPRLLAGDFNEPREYRRSGQIVTWGPLRGARGVTETDKEWTDKFGESRRASDWSRGVMRILAGAPFHGLRDVYRQCHGFDRTPITHRTPQGNPRCFDHAFASRHFDIKSAGYQHTWREQGLSDHSALWFEIALRDDVPSLVQWDTAESGNTSTCDDG